MTREAWIVFDLGFGDAGKGATVDFLVRDRAADLVVRYHGGAQAGHNVVTPDGRHHTFSQFGSGTFSPGVKTLLGPGFVLHPGALEIENQHLCQLGVTDALTRLWVDESVRVISPFQQVAGRLREIARGQDHHGTCGIGFGETVRDVLAGKSDAIYVSDFRDLDCLTSKLKSQQHRKWRRFQDSRLADDQRAEDELRLLTDPDSVERVLSIWRPIVKLLNILTPADSRRLIRDSNTVIFEGAQGVLLDQDHGFHPHTTWSDCTPRGALQLLTDNPAQVFRLGVTRSYLVRHGTGPMPTWSPCADGNLPEPHNDTCGWQGPFRRGLLDLVLLRYALTVCGGADGLAVTFMDSVGPIAKVCTGYSLSGDRYDLKPLLTPVTGDAASQLTMDLHRIEPQYECVAGADLIQTLSICLETPVWLTSHGPTANDRRWLRRPRSRTEVYH